MNDDIGRLIFSILCAAVSVVAAVLNHRNAKEVRKKRKDVEKMMQWHGFKQQPMQEDEAEDK